MLYRSPFSVSVRPGPFDLDAAELDIRYGPQNPSIVILGDSTADRWRYREALLNEYLPGERITNLGVGGIGVSNLLGLVRSGALGGAFNPTIFLVMIGTNDLGKRNSVPLLRPRSTQIAHGIELVAASLNELFPDAQVIVAALLDDPSFSHCSERREVNLALENYPNRHFMLCQLECGDTDSVAASDTIHLSDLAYERLAQALQRTLISSVQA
jgi:lysophospholipase L1-like esterase